LIKIKARLCAGGHRQPRDDNIETSSPAVNRWTIMILCTIAAAQGREIATADVNGAYLEALMTSDVYMQLDHKISAILVTLYPHYVNFLENGQLTVKLDRALYGCIESALLWNKEITHQLSSIGFKQSSEDECLFFKGDGEHKVHVGVYVDDLLISAKSLSEIQEVEERLSQKFRDITFNYGKIHEYLGINLNFTTPGVVSMKMTSKIQELLNEYQINRSSASPAANSLMEYREQDRLPPDKSKSLRSGIAKLLYLSINTRPDIALPVNYLCTRVNDLNEDDYRRFIRVLQYLKGTIDLGLTLKCPESKPSINLYADAADKSIECPKLECVAALVRLQYWQDQKTEIGNKIFNRGGTCRCS